MLSEFLVFFGCPKSMQFLILSFFSRLVVHVTSTLPWLLKCVKASSSSKLCTDYFLLLTFALLFPQCAGPVLRDATHASDYQLLSNPIEGFPRGGKYHKHVPHPILSPLIPNLMKYLQ